MKAYVYINPKAPAKVRGSRRRPDAPHHQRTNFLWTEVTGSAPADGISINVKGHRPTRAALSDNSGTSVIGIDIGN
jgi:hypothetical protein